ncbi:hypothetical protein [Streptomyces sp. NPDC102462]
MITGGRAGGTRVLAAALTRAVGAVLRATAPGGRERRKRTNCAGRTVPAG